MYASTQVQQERGGFGRNFRDRDDDGERGDRHHKVSEDWGNIRGSMAESKANMRGKNAIDSNLKEDENDEFMSQNEDKKQKKNFMNKILKDLDENDKDTMVKIDNEMKKSRGFASRFNDDEDDVVADDWRKPNKMPEREERTLKRGFGSRFEDNEQDRPSSKVTREDPIVRQEVLPKAQGKINSSSKGFASRFKDDDDDDEEEDKPVNVAINKPLVEKIDDKPKPESKPRGFASRFKDDDDDEEEDKPRAFINKIKTITSDVESSSKINPKEAIAFKKKNRIIEEDFSEDEADNSQDKQSNSKFNANEFEFEPKKSAED